MTTPKWPHDHEEKHRQAALKGARLKKNPGAILPGYKRARSNSPASYTFDKEKLDREVYNIAASTKPGDYYTRNEKLKAFRTKLYEQIRNLKEKRQEQSERMDQLQSEEDDARRAKDTKTEKAKKDARYKLAAQYQAEATHINALVKYADAIDTR